MFHILCLTSTSYWCGPPSREQQPLLLGAVGGFYFSSDHQVGGLIPINRTVNLVSGNSRHLMCIAYCVHHIFLLCPFILCGKGVEHQRLAVLWSIMPKTAEAIACLLFFHVGRDEHTCFILWVNGAHTEWGLLVPKSHGPGTLSASWRRM